MFKKLRNFFYGAILVHLLWIAGTLFVDDRLIPSPWDVYGLMSFDFWQMMSVHIWMSLWRLVLALVISLLIGLVFGVLAAESKIIAAVLNPFIYFLYPIPKMALLPLVMVLFGLGNTPIIVMIVIIIVFQIIINVRDGINAIPTENYQVLIVIGASKWELFKNVTFPAALAQILSAARVALGTATAILFITETTGTRYGVGHFIMTASNTFNYLNMFAGIVVLTVLSYFLFLIIDILERYFLSWQG